MAVAASAMAVLPGAAAAEVTAAVLGSGNRGFAIKADLLEVVGVAEAVGTN